MPDAHKNFAYSTVATAPSPATTGNSLVVAPGDGAKFPTPPFNVTIWPFGMQPLTTNAEVARCTGISTDTLTITRAQEGSTARSVGVGDQISATITAKTLQDVEMGVVQLPVGAAVLPDGTANNLGPGLVRIKGTVGSYEKFFLVLAYDQVNLEIANWTFRMPITPIGLTVKLLWMANAISGAVHWRARLSVITPGDVDTPLEHAFANYNFTTTNVNTTEARRLTETVISLTNLDNAAVGDLAFIQIYRDGGQADDTCTVDAELIHASIEVS
jgi:hypothetical protein